eukprot:Clim_evm12s88 gene=Clim_evmTU12s88
MNVEEVCSWVNSIGLPECVDNFRDHRVDYELLLTLNHDVLKDLGVHSIGKRVKILKEVEMLMASRQMRNSHHVKIIRKYGSGSTLSPQKRRLVESASKKTRVVKQKSRTCESYNVFIKQIVDKYGVEALTKVDSKGFAPVHYATAMNNISAIDLLSTYEGALLVRDRQGNTALHTAVQNNSGEMVAHLLVHNVPVYFRNRQGLSALEMAIRKNCTNVIDIIMKAVHQLPKEMCQKQLDFALLEATAAMNIKTVHSLLDNGANANFIGGYGRRALHIAARAQSLDLVKLLIGFGADADAVDVYGRTALHYSAVIGHTDAALTLKAAMKSTNFASDDEETLSVASPCELAQSEGHSDLAQLLS